MAEKFPYLARQINGPIAMSFGKGIDSVYERDAEFIDFLSRFSIDIFNIRTDNISVAHFHSPLFVSTNHLITYLLYYLRYDKPLTNQQKKPSK